MTHYQAVADTTLLRAVMRDRARRAPVFRVLSIPKLPVSIEPGMYHCPILINAVVDTREEVLEYQQWAEYVAGEVAWIEVR